jgi:hypothetical protein
VRGASAGTVPLGSGAGRSLLLLAVPALSSLGLRTSLFWIGTKVKWARVLLLLLLFPFPLVSVLEKWEKCSVCFVVNVSMGR